MSDEWTVVLTVENEQEGELIEGFLRSQDIPCEAESQVSHPYPTSIGTLGVVKIRVPEERAEEARRLIAEREALEFPEEPEPDADTSDLQSATDGEEADAES